MKSFAETIDDSYRNVSLTTREKTDMDFNDKRRKYIESAVKIQKRKLHLENLEKKIEKRKARIDYWKDRWIQLLMLLFSIISVSVIIYINFLK